MTRLPSAPLTYLITRGEATPAAFRDNKSEIFETVRSAVDDGVSMIQIREKNLPARLLFELAVDAATITKGSNTKLLINDRPDIAVAARADGVHLPSDSLPVDVIRAKFPRIFIIGVSTHSIDEVRHAQMYGADFAVFGPVFETPGKGPAAGLEELREVVSAAAAFPIIALGGIDESNFRAALKNGAAGIAAIRALNDPISRMRIITEIYGGLR